MRVRLIVSWLLLLLITKSFGKDLVFRQEANFNPIMHYCDFPRVDFPGLTTLNPAWMVNEVKEKSSYQITVFENKGDLKLPFEPKRRWNIFPTATGAKRFRQEHLFTAAFSYHYQLQNDKLWVHNRAPYNGSPFLLGDSTIGGFQLKGICWEAVWSGFLKNNLTSGVAIFYNVDEEYKTVFPRSQIKHRDVLFKYGLGWYLKGDQKFGLSLSYFDFQEIMKTTPYTLEQGRTPVFIKIRATDNPLKAYGQTSEERLSAIQGFSLLQDGNLRFNNTRLAYYVGTENTQSQNTDGGAYPVAQGKWSSEKYYFKTSLRYPLGKRTGMEIFSLGALFHLEAKHPEIKRKIYELKNKGITLGLRGEIKITSKMGLLPQVFGNSTCLKRTDYYNGNLDYFPQESFGFSQGVLLGSPDWNYLLLKLGWEKVNIGATILSQRQDWYYRSVTQAEQTYYFRDKRVFTGELTTQVKALGRSWILTVDYTRTSPENGSPKKKFEDVNINFKVEY